ncbi:endonuclease/exonuclease/phosphatase family protein [Candidatus Collierbacteria bacterium]|nr:endonuclease/exonuclease/phosphatase family protein [Candidatus Collierbacteria bacterium]
MEIKIVSLNIEGDKHLPEVVRLVGQKNPDAVCLQEVFEDDFHLLHRQFDMKGIFMPTVWIDSPGMPRFGKQGPFGAAMFSRLAGEFGGNYYFKRRGSKLPRYQGKPNAGHRCLVWQKIDNGLTIATTHFTWSKNGLATQKQHRELGALSKLLDKLHPDVVCGDFNAPRGGEIWSKLAEQMIDNIPPGVKTTLDPALHYANGVELVVDGFFTNRKNRIIVKSLRLVNGVSDHLAVSAIISWYT